MAKILVACEESQAVTIAFRNLGHEAYSCDVLPCSGGYPQWHLQQDVTPLLKEQWDMIIAFPPCTYLTKTGAPSLRPKGVLNTERYLKGLEAKKFFMMFYNHKCDKVVIENPTPLKCYELPPPSQVIQPWQFGHPYQKRTLLWLKGVPPLEPTQVIDVRESTVTAKWYNTGIKNRSIYRSKTFQGVAEAMAAQWSVLF